MCVKDSLKSKDRRGNVLLLALFVLSSVLLGATAISAVMVRELRTNQTTDDGHAAFYAAETGIEQSLYNLRRAGQKPADQDASGGLANGASWTRQAKAGEPVLTVRSLKRDDFVEIDLLDPDNLAMPTGIEAVSFDWQDGCGGASAVELAYAEWPAGAVLVWPPGGDFTGTYWKFRHTTADGLPWLKSDTISGGNDYRMRLTAVGCDLRNLQVRAYADDAATLPKDVPTRVTIHATGSSGRASETLTAAMDRLPPLSGVFDFVLFSEQPIVK
jgi:hypothetical protein